MGRVTTHLRDRLGRFGVWRPGAQVTAQLAADLEQAGFGALWIGGSPGGDLDQIEELLAATQAMPVGTSIVNIWKDDPHVVARSFARLEASYPGRFVLGVGTGHPEATQRYQHPYDAISGYVTELRAGGVPQDALVLAALGPRLLRLAGERTAGAIPYLVPPEHTRRARDILGPEPLLAPEQKVVLDSDPVTARRLGRERLKPYLGMVNYTSNLRRLGWSDDDLSGDGSDALTDTLAVHGTAAEVAVRLREHLDAGADHVAIQLLTATGADPLPGYHDLAAALQLC
jgi:probable F420-dependent oxidoreductase